MNRMRTKMLAGGVVVTVAVVFLAIAGVREGWTYYLAVDQFVEGEAEKYRNERVRLHGMVDTDGFDVRPAALRASFGLRGERAVVAVEYSGIIPDMFQPDREVVVEGRLDGDGVFRADTLMTKCASKYETENGQAPHADPSNPGTEG